MLVLIFNLFLCPQCNEIIQFLITMHHLQAYGAMGVCQDTALPFLYGAARTLRLADGPDEVHRMTLCRMEVRTQNLAKL
jgi:alkylation response protein AidB-like acyl-CoA dehydrogenase